MFLFSVSELNHLDIIGTINNPVGMAIRQPTKKSRNQILKKLSQYPECTYSIPAVMTIVIEIETKILDNKLACFIDNFINTKKKKGCLKKTTFK